MTTLSEMKTLAESVPEAIETMKLMAEALEECQRLLRNETVIGVSMMASAALAEYKKLEQSHDR